MPDSHERANWKDVARTIGFILVLALVGAFLMMFQRELARSTAAVVALAAFTSGAALGFLFGIPRVLQKDTPPAQSPPSGDVAISSEGGVESNYRLQVNTNLEQISDWLTKILVGVGLIELRELPGVLTSIAARIQPAAGATNSVAVSIALIISFTIVGFFAGYLTTRLYLAGAFFRADTLVVGGQLVPIDEVSKQIRDLLADVTQHMVRAPTADAAAAPAPRERGRGGDLGVRSILWVDDQPRNNSVLVEQLQKLNIDVAQSVSTADALASFDSGRFDCIISDMGRREHGRMNPTAGLDLLRAVRQRDPDIRFIIYCSPEAAAKNEQIALSAGATAITASPTKLLRAVLEPPG